MTHPKHAESLDESWWASLMATEEGEKTAVVDQPAHPPPASPRVDKQHANTLTAEQDVDWQLIYDLQQSEEVIDCEVIDYNRGGLLVQTEEFKGFVPVSHLMELEVPEQNQARDNFLRQYIGQEMQIKVIECDPERGRIVLSERAALAPPGQRQALFRDLEIGDRLSGVVTNITDFGIFVDLGGVEGLVHISEISWGRVMKPADFVEVGESLNVIVLQIDSDTDKISLSIKRLLENPWASAVERFPVETEVDVTITEVVKYGAFARLEEGLEGLIHVSEMNLNGFDKPADILAPGEIVVAEILSIDPDHQRLSLRLKQ